MKIKHIIIILVLLLPIVSAYTEVEYSLDNSTWIYCAYTNNNSVVIEELDNGLSGSKDYYFRLRNIYESKSTNWTYISTKTKGTEEVISMSFTSLIGIGVILLISFLFLVISLYNENGLFGVISGVCFLISGLILITTGISGIAANFTLGIGVIICLVGVFVCIISLKGD